MTMPVGSASSFVMIGNREDLSDEIYRITPTKTPFLSMADREKATNTLHEWQTMDLAANTATNVQLEGDDATLDSPTTTVRLNNYTTIPARFRALPARRSRLTTRAATRKWPRRSRRRCS